MTNFNKKTRGESAAATPPPLSTKAEHHRPTVLVVDDDRRFAQAIADCLEALGIDALTAFDGNAGLAVALTQNPALVVLDSRMPYRSGYLVLEYMATDTDLQIPTIVISENEGRRHRDYAKMLGAVDFFEKPINANELASRISEWLADSNPAG